MSWMSKKTGRPKEQGGHRRRDFSVDKFTDDVLQKVDNKSKFIEYTIRTCMQSKRIRFHEPKETMNNDQDTFKNAATFIWAPNNNKNNAILSIRCYFQYCCPGGGLRFRMVINGETDPSGIGWLTSASYTLSRLYTDYDLGFPEVMKIFPNQSNYTIEFQFEPRSSLDIAYVKDITIFIDVADGMPALSP